jgi:predicted amidohydrolase
MANIESVKIALVQYPIDTQNSFDFFLAKHEAILKSLTAQKIDLIVFPELVALDLVDFNKDLPTQWKKISSEDHPRYIDFFKSYTKKTGIAVLTGSLPAIENGKIHNQCRFIDHGETVSIQNKVFLTPDEKAWNWSGGTSARAFQWRGIQTAILICHDAEFPTLSNQLATENIELLLVPSMTHDDFGVNRVRWCSMARSVEHHCYTLVTGTTENATKAREYCGQAAVITPQNSLHTTEILLGRYNQPDILITELDLRKLRQGRTQKDFIYPVRDQNERR